MKSLKRDHEPRNVSWNGKRFMPLLDYFYVLQFENKEYFKLFKLEEDGYLISSDLHGASKNVQYVRSH